MNHYTVYSSVTGEILTIYTLGPEENIESYLQSEQEYVQGVYHYDQYYVDVTTGVFVEKPSKPKYYYYWDETNKTYTYDENYLISIARNERNELLQLVDKINPLWYNSLTKQQQIELQTFRQQLLDITKQDNFPNNIEWPPVPEWIR